MQRAKIRQLLKLYGAVDAQLVETGGGWVNGPCIFARWTHAKGTDSHPSFGIKVDRLQSTYFCFACQASGFLERLVRVHMQLSGQRNIEAEQLVQQYDCDLTADIPCDSEEDDDSDAVLEIINRSFPAELYDRATTYLAGRDIPMALIDRWGLLYDPREDRVVVPVRDRLGGLVGVVGRAIAPDLQPRYRTKGRFRRKGVWAGVHRVIPEGAVVLVEGIFDFLKVSAGGVANVLCSCGASIARQQLVALRDLLANRPNPTLRLWFDNDSAGREAIERVETFFKDSAVAIYVVPETVPDPKGVALDNIRPVLLQAPRAVGGGGYVHVGPS